MPHQDYRSFDFQILKMSYMGRKSDRDETFHNFHELFYVQNGRCSVLIGPNFYTLSEGDFGIIPAGALHRTTYLSDGLNTKYVISFSDALNLRLRDFLELSERDEPLSEGRIFVPQKRRNYVEELLAKLLFEYEEEALLSSAVIRALLSELLLIILRCRTYDTEGIGRIDAERSRMQTVAKYIYENYDKKLSLESLAREFSLSPTYLSKCFRADTGFGLKEYITNVRIRNAASLLLTTSLSVTEIAFSCGFRDSNYFGDAFKRATGLSPRDYRKYL